MNACFKNSEWKNIVVIKRQMIKLRKNICTTNGKISLIDRDLV